MPGSSVKLDEPIRIQICHAENPQLIFFKLEINRRRLLHALLKTKDRDTIHGTLMGALVR